MVNQPLWIDDGSGPVRNPELSDEEFSALLEAARLRNIESLWQSAHDYEYGYISGTAIGMLTMGVMQSKPVSLAIQNWIVSIWALYYQRKSLVTAEYDAALYDFSSAGPMPHTVPELMGEILGQTGA